MSPRAAAGAPASLALAPALWLLVCAASPAAAQTCGEHLVRAGDSLSRIARDAPGSPSPQAVFEANRDRLSSPDHIEIGQTLRLPCPPGASGEPPSEAGTGASEGGSAGAPEDAAPPGGEADPDLPSERPDAAAALPSPPPTPPDPEAGAIRLAWGGDASAMPAGERARTRLQAALARGASGRETEISAAPRAARAQIAPGGEADLAFAWIAPDCAALARLDAGSAELCARYDFSAPLAVTEVAWFVPAGAETSGAADLAGERICRPEGAPDGDLAALGLAPPRARRLAPASAADCLRLLREGEAEAAALFVEGAPAAGPGLRRLEALGGPLSLVALAHPANPRGRAALAALNRGLSALDEEEAGAEAGEAAGPDAEARE